jgi:hypothetical protein
VFGVPLPSLLSLLRFRLSTLCLLALAVLCVQRELLSQWTGVEVQRLESIPLAAAVCSVQIFQWIIFSGLNRFYHAVRNHPTTPCSASSLYCCVFF